MDEVNIKSINKQLTKKEAREWVRRQKRQMHPKEIEQKSQTIVDKLGKDSCFLQAKSLYCYVSYNQEVMTKPLITKALELGKKVAVPKVIGDDIEFFYIQSLEELGKGYQGIEEPMGDVGELTKAEDEEALMILPGLAFDESCNRVGYGGGYYDRYLSKHEEHHFKKLALAFDFQVVHSLEMEACDWKVDGILTEQRKIGG